MLLEIFSPLENNAVTTSIHKKDESIGKSDPESTIDHVHGHLQYRPLTSENLLAEGLAARMRALSKKRGIGPVITRLKIAYTNASASITVPQPHRLSGCPSGSTTRQ